jgi:wyosine [tRNA(Phe)-imidazoG37] synthetase (radical SAM superfamily)
LAAGGHGVVNVSGDGVVAENSGKNKAYGVNIVVNSVIYGPVPSRRLGHSLGINNIPPKICSYSCVYCQLGNTIDMQVERQTFYDPKEIAQIAKEKIRQIKERGEPIDYLAFVPDGEPTLDVNLGRAIDLLKSLNIKIAVITNASLLLREDTRQDLQKADWVSLKVDTVSEEMWRHMNRPHKSLDLPRIFDGMLNFATTYKGELTTETMLLHTMNDTEGECENTANFLAQLKPTKAYVAIPIRPPAKRQITAASEHALTRAYQIFTTRLRNVEYLIGYEGNAFAFTGNVENDLLSITSVHPMREEAVVQFLKKADTGWGAVERLISNDALLEVEYQNKKFYIRKFR